MELQFPDALVPELTRRLRKHQVRLFPSDTTLRKLLALSFYASLEREEGRPVRFALMLTDSEALRSRAEGCWAPIRFEASRPASVREIVKLAPATDPDQTYIALVEREIRASESNGELEIAGLIRTNRDHTRMARGESQSAVSVKLNYVRMSVRAPGTFALGLQHHDLVHFANGKLLGDSIPVLHVGGPVLAAFERVVRGQSTAESDPPVHRYMQVVRQALREALWRAHGGAC